MQFKLASKLTILAITGGLVATAQAAEFSFDDIDFWVGSGSNEAGIVIDWNDGIEPQSLAWGYRWDGAATGEDMFLAVVTADPAMYAKVSPSGEYGVSLYGIGCDADADGFALTDGTAFVDGLAITAPSDGETAVDADDHYAEGWLSGSFWSYWIGGPAAWTSPAFGMSGRTLSDGDWDGFSFAVSWETMTAPSAPVAAVPEPTGLVFFGLGMMLAWRRR